MGAIIVVSMQNYLAQFGEWVTVIQGAVFVACVLAFRRGIIGELAARATGVAVGGESASGSRRGGSPAAGFFKPDFSLLRDQER